MDINLEKYTEDLLKGYCDKKPSTKNKFNKNIKVIKMFSTNVLENHEPSAIKECKIRDSDPLVNISDPIAKTKEDYENILGNIIEAECKLLDTSNSNKLMPDLLKLINFCNIRILEFNKNPIKSVENCNFKIKVFNRKQEILFNESALYSLYVTLYDFLRNMIPLRICKSIDDIKLIYETIIHVVSERDPGYSECKLTEYTFQTNEGNRICLTNNSEKIITITKFILDLYNEFCMNDGDKPYLEDLKIYIDNTLQTNIYNAFEPLNPDNYYYLSNSGDGDCLFIAIAKYLSIVSNTERQYPNNYILKTIAKELRFETCKYMFHNRYKIVNDTGSIENTSDAMVWLLNSKGGETNNQRFISLMNSLKIKRNMSIFKNPTHYTLEELIDLFKRSEIDDFTKYCILMAQYSMGSEHFLLEDSTKLYLSCSAGICEIVCAGLLLNKNIICSSTTLKEGDEDFKYNISTKFSYTNKYNPDEHIEMPILIYLRGYKTKRGGSKSDHYEMLWPKSMGKPTGINFPRELTESQQPLFAFNTTHIEKFVPNYDTSNDIDIELPVYNLDNFISSNIPRDYTELIAPIIRKHWKDISEEVSSNADTLKHPNFGNQDKEVFVKKDKIRIKKFLYSVGYLTKFTNIIEKGFATKNELDEIIATINKSKKIDTNKPIEIKISEADEEGNVKAIYTNFRDKQILLNLLKNKEISQYHKPKKVKTEEEAFKLTEKPKTVTPPTINLADDKWVIFGDYYYKKSYIQLPLKDYVPTNKQIIKTLKRLHLHKQSNPIRVVENFGSGSGESEYVYSIYTEDDVDDLESDLLQKLLKKIPSDKLDISEIQAGNVIEDNISIVNSLSPQKALPQKNLDIKIRSSKKQNPSQELKLACEKKTRKGGGLYKVAFRNSLIEYIKKLYNNNPERALKEVKRLKKLKHRKDLENYCIEIDIL